MCVEGKGCSTTHGDATIGQTDAHRSNILRGYTCPQIVGGNITFSHGMVECNRVVQNAVLISRTE